MPRNASGTMTLPAGNPVVSGTTIASTTHNNTTGDIANEISDSLSRSGKGPMLAPVRTPDGTVAAPTHTFTNETGSGLYRAAAGDVRATVLGVDALRVTNVAGSTGVTVPGTLSVPGALGVTGASTLGNVTVTGTAAISGAETLGDNVELTKASAQSILKAGGGALQIGTKTGNNSDVEVLVNGTVKASLLAAGGLDVKTQRIVNVTDPSGPQDAATKAYVDGVMGAAMKTADQSESDGGASVAVTDMAFAVEANKIYEFEFWLVTSSAAVTTGLIYQFSSPVGVVSAPWILVWPDTNTPSQNLQVHTNSNFTSVSTTAGHPASRTIQKITGIMENGANAGTIQLQFKTEVAASAVTIHKGSVVHFRKLN